MRLFLFTILVITSSILVLWRFHPDLRKFADSFGGQQAQTADSPASAAELSSTGIARLARYDDADYGFSVAIPEGWTRIVADDNDIFKGDDLLAWLEPGYAVGFESPRSDLADKFADYILIEVLPGDDSGLFEATDEQRHFIHSGSEKIAYDRLEIDADSDNVSEVDLVIFQRGVQALGYTLGFYAIGEPVNEQTLFDAFQILLRTYTQTSDPFVVI